MTNTFSVSYQDPLFDYDNIQLEKYSLTTGPQRKKQNKLLEDVRDFHTKFGMRDGWEPTERNLFGRYYMMLEEVEEFKEAVEKDDKVAIIDALCDLVYFAMGTADLMGIDFDSHWNAVQNCNMQKIRGNKASRPNSFGFDMIKPEGFIPPEEEHKRILEK